MQATTKLEAVNAMLSAAAEAPVSTLAGNNGAQVQIALAILDEASRRVQGDGWTFNRFETVFLKDIDGKIPVNADIISLDDPNQNSSDHDYTIRGGFLWDVTKNTDQFDADVTMIATIFLEWEDLPFHARDFIMARAIRMYTDRTVGTPTLGQFTRQDELEAMARFKRTEMEIGDYHVLDNETYRRIILRRI